MAAGAGIAAAQPIWSKESSVPFMLSSGRTIQVSPNFNSLDDRAAVVARTIMLHRADPSKHVTPDAVVAAISAYYPGKDPKVYIDAMYRYEKDYAVFCVEFASKEFADHLKLMGELAVKWRDDPAVIINCKVS